MVLELCILNMQLPGFRARGSGLGFPVWGLGFKNSGLGFMDLVFGVWSCRFGV